MFMKMSHYAYLVGFRLVLIAEFEKVTDQKLLNVSQLSRPDLTKQEFHALLTELKSDSDSVNPFNEGLIIDKSIKEASPETSCLSTILFVIHSEW